MKIAILSDALYPFTLGGSEIRNHEICKRLAKSGHDVHICGVKWWDGDNTITVDGVVLHGVSTYSTHLEQIGALGIVLNQTLLGVKTFFWLLRNDFDVIDVAHFIFPNCYTARLAAALKRTPAVFTWHQYFGREYLVSMFGKIAGTLASFFERPTTKLSQFNIAVSEIVQRDLAALGMPEKNIEIIYNGVDIRTADNAQPLEKEYDVIFVGRLVYQKHPELLVRAIHVLTDKFPSIKACIIGDGYKKNELLRLVDSLHISKNFDFVGEVSDREKVFQYLKSSKMFVLPSLFEGFPLTIVEAGACGIPIIVVNSKWNRAVNFVNGNGLVTEPTPQSLAQAIAHLLKNANTRTQMGAEGKRITREFDFDKIATQTETYYRKVIETWKQK